MTSQILREFFVFFLAAEYVIKEIYLKLENIDELIKIKFYAMSL